LDGLGELRDLLWSQIHHSVLRVRIEQEDHVASCRPIVDDASATALPPRSNRNAHLAYPTAASDDSAGFRMRGDPELKLTILLIAQQSCNLLREDGSFNQLDLGLLSAIGG